MAFGCWLSSGSWGCTGSVLLLGGFRMHSYRICGLRMFSLGQRRRNDPYSSKAQAWRMKTVLLYMFLTQDRAARSQESWDYTTPRPQPPMIHGVCVCVRAM